MCFGCIDSVDIEITLKLRYIHHAQTSLLDDCAGGSQGVHSSLMDKIRAKYEQLDSGEFGSPGTPAFDAEACELANLLAHVSKLCKKTEPANAKGIVQAHVLQAFSSKLQVGSLVRVWRMHSISMYLHALIFISTVLTNIP